VLCERREERRRREDMKKKTKNVIENPDLNPTIT
jgi:hypothetical protein